MAYLRLKLLKEGLVLTAVSVLRPRARDWADDEPPSLGVAFIAVALWGMGYSALYLILSLAGHQPSMVRGIPVDPSIYYGCAAAYALPLCFCLAWLVGSTADAASGRRRGWRFGFRAFSGGYAGPMLWCFIVPDLVTYAVAGFDALSLVMRVTGPLAVSLILVRTYVVSRSIYDVRPLRCVLMTAAAALAQLVPAALLLR